MINEQLLLRQHLKLPKRTGFFGLNSLLDKSIQYFFIIVKKHLITKPKYLK